MYVRNLLFSIIFLAGKEISSVTTTFLFPFFYNKYVKIYNFPGLFGFLLKKGKFARYSNGRKIKPSPIPKGGLEIILKATFSI